MSESLYPEKPVLIVDDEPMALKSYEMAFLSSGVNNVIACADSREVESILEHTEVELVLLDLIMPYLSGVDLLKLIIEHHPHIPVIMVTGVNEVDSAVECMRCGAVDYILKPVKTDSFISRIEKAMEFGELRRENQRLHKTLMNDSPLPPPAAFAPVITADNGMLAIFNYCEAIAGSRQPVLITGETGVGKELFARAIHDLSVCPGEFVGVNIAGFDDAMLSDTLFGHRKGAFTGAIENRNGMIEKASDGTLFLDEIGDINIASQVKLLRLLQEREYTPLGIDSPRRSNARIVLATHHNLMELQKNSKFRKDLYYRISTHHIHIPPLRKRKDDIKLLVDHFLKAIAEEQGKKTPSYHPELITLLKSYHFPGNVRELQCMMYDAVSNHQSKMLSMRVFLEHIKRNSGASAQVFEETGQGDDSDWSVNLENLPTIRQATDSLVREALRRADSNQSVAAKILGITPQALSARIKKNSDLNSF